MRILILNKLYGFLIEIVSYIRRTWLQVNALSGYLRENLIMSKSAAPGIK